MIGKYILRVVCSVLTGSLLFLISCSLLNGASSSSSSNSSGSSSSFSQSSSSSSSSFTNSNSTNTNTSSGSQTKIVIICGNLPDPIASSYSNFLTAEGYTSSIIGLSNVLSYNFTNTKLIIIGGAFAWYTNSYLYLNNEANILLNSRIPIISLLGNGGTGKSVYDTPVFNFFINMGQSATGFNMDGVFATNTTDAFWSSPSNLNVSVNQPMKLYSTAQSFSGILWVGAPSTAFSVTYTNWVDSYTYYSMLAYQTTNNVKYFYWGCYADPSLLTSQGTNLFLNVLCWLTN